MALRRVILIVILIAAFTSPLELPGCGGGYPMPVFTLTRQPDDPNAFQLGQLGALRPTYDVRYLVIAYRHLVGVGLSDKERAALAAPAEAPDNPQPWVNARAELKLPLAEVPNPYRAIAQQGYMNMQLNCGPDAFRTAAATLRDRAQRFGAASPLLREWIGAQDMVFANCKSGESIPQAATDPQLRADRDYQIAAAKFYSRHFEDARADFDRIARDVESPWRTSAPYLAARCLIRAEKFPEAERQLETVLADPACADWHDRARRLINYVALRTRPAERLQELGKSLTLSNSEQTIGQDLIDFSFAYSPDKAHDELSDWITTLRSKDRVHALERWNTTKTVPWLVAAIETARPHDPAAAELLDAARALPATSPGYLTVSIHALRLAPPDAARASAARLLRLKLPYSARNLILGQRLRLARNFDEFLSDAPRTPVGENGMDGETPSAKDETWFDLDSAGILNECVPLRRLQEAAASPRLPANLRHELKQVTFARSVILSDSPGFDDVLTLLRLPERGPWVEPGYGHLGNWWGPHLNNPVPPPAAFLSPEDRAQAAAEWTKLSTLPAAPSWLGAQTLAFAATHPDDPRVPEALHRVVRATRYGIRDKDNGKYSRRAFDLLHHRYPKSEWTGKTPYWFN